MEAVIAAGTGTRGEVLDTSGDDVDVVVEREPSIVGGCRRGGRLDYMTKAIRWKMKKRTDAKIT